MFDQHHGKPFLGIKYIFIEAITIYYPHTKYESDRRAHVMLILCLTSHFGASTKSSTLLYLVLAISVVSVSQEAAGFDFYYLSFWVFWVFWG